MNNNQFFIFKWRKKDNIANLTTWNNKCFYEWRTQQSDWKSTNGLVLYDRFGSKISLDNGICETKLTDVGKKHWELYNKWVNEIFFNKRNDTIIELRKELDYLENLFPVKNLD
jgi:hypothetical protein